MSHCRAGHRLRAGNQRHGRVHVRQQRSAGVGPAVGQRPQQCAAVASWSPDHLHRHEQHRLGPQRGMRHVPVVQVRRCALTSAGLLCCRGFLLSNWGSLPSPLLVAAVPVGDHHMLRQELALASRRRRCLLSGSTASSTTSARSASRARWTCRGHTTSVTAAGMSSGSRSPATCGPFEYPCRPHHVVRCRDELTMQVHTLLVLESWLVQSANKACQW